MILFYSYSHKDEGLRDELEVHLSVLQRQNIIEFWHDRRIRPGSDWEASLKANLNDAEVILLLVSADFLASDYCYGQEVQTALERHELGTATVIPIILRACDWHASPLGKIQALPKDGKPITSWPNRDEAWSDVARGIRFLVDTALAREPVRAMHTVEQNAPLPQTLLINHDVAHLMPRSNATADISGAALAHESVGAVHATEQKPLPQTSPISHVKIHSKARASATEKAVSSLVETALVSANKIVTSEHTRAINSALFGNKQDWLALAKTLCVLGVVPMALFLADNIANSTWANVVVAIASLLTLSICVFFLKRKRLANKIHAPGALANLSGESADPANTAPNG